MSLWRMTHFDDVLAQELTSITLMPDVEETDDAPFESYLLLTDEAYEAEWFSLHTALEVALCKQQRKAAVCLPGRILRAPNALAYITREVPARFTSLFPLKLVGIYGEGNSMEWLQANAEALHHTLPLLHDLSEITVSTAK